MFGIKGPDLTAQSRKELPGSFVWRSLDAASATVPGGSLIAAIRSGRGMDDASFSNDLIAPEAKDSVRVLRSISTTR